MESLDVKSELHVTVKIEIKTETAQLKQEPSDFQLVEDPSHCEFADGDGVRSQTGTTLEPVVFNSGFESLKQEEILGLPSETVDEWVDQGSNPEHVLDEFKEILDFDENVDSKRKPPENLDSDLKKRERIHSDEKLFECGECGKRFCRLGNLKRHNRIHTEETPYQCRHCTKRFNQRSHLRQHEKIHSGEKPHECGECGKRFGRLGSLRLHIRIHTEEKPYSCSHCSKRFTSNSNLRRHERIHK